MTKKKRFEFITDLRKIIQNIPEIAKCKAGLFQDHIESELIKIDYNVVREFQVPDRGDGKRGFIDLVIDSPLIVGIELDGRIPRMKSIRKLRYINGLKVIVLREYSCDTTIICSGDLVIIGPKGELIKEQRA